MTTTTKYGIEISTDPHTGYRVSSGWDYLYATRKEAEDAARRAASKFCGARVYAIDVPPHVDHLYQSLCGEDTTALYGISSSSPH